MPLWFHNLAAYSVQFAALALAGTALQAGFRLRLPKVSLMFWQGLLLICLLLPFIEPWQNIANVPSREIGMVTYESTPAVATTSHFLFPVYESIALFLALGVFARLIWIVLGLRRLRHHKERATCLNPIPAELNNLQYRLKVAPEFMLSASVSGPVTFGCANPVVLFPSSFAEMDSNCQRAIACHELLHVRRRDWLFSLAEEVVLAALWFHPAAWWLVKRIRLAREAAVDREVLELTLERKPYLKALLEIATSTTHRRIALAPEFMDEGQLVQRVALMLKEVSMSQTRIILSLSAIAAFLLASAHMVIGAFPLKVLRPEPVAVVSSDAASMIQTRNAGSADGVDARPEPKKLKGNSQLQITRRVDPEYPPLAKLARIEGKVELELTVEKDGTVSDIKVLSGHPLLADAAMKAVRQWRYVPPRDHSVVTDVAVNFELAKDKSDAEKFAEAKARLELEQAQNNERMTQEQQETIARLQAKIAQAKSRDNAESAEQQQEALAKLKALQDALLAKVEASRQTDDIQTQEQQLAEMKAQKAGLEAKIAAAEALLKETQSKNQPTASPKAIKKAPPVYPPEAKRDHIQGTVILRATIDEDGNVSKLEAESGADVLVKAAMEAVKKWRFSKPAFAPVETDIKINFTLADPNPSPASPSQSPR